MIRIVAVVLILALALATVASATSWGEIKIAFTPRDNGPGNPPPPPPPPPPDGLTSPGDPLSLTELVQLIMIVLLAEMP